jgi:hypothetical protein
MRTMAYRAAHGAVLIIRPFDAHVIVPIQPHNVEIIAAQTAAIVPKQMDAGVQTGTNAAIRMTQHAKTTAGITHCHRKSAPTPALCK